MTAVLVVHCSSSSDNGLGTDMCMLSSEDLLSSIAGVCFMLHAVLCARPDCHKQAMLEVVCAQLVVQVSV